MEIQIFNNHPNKGFTDLLLVILSYSGEDFDDSEFITEINI